MFALLIAPVNNTEGYDKYAYMTPYHHVDGFEKV